MATLTRDTVRKLGDSPRNFVNMDVIASDIIYRGAFVGESSSTGDGRPLVGGDTFVGIADAQADNSSGSAGDITVRLIQSGQVVMPVAGATSNAMFGDKVYANDDNVLTITASGSSLMGKIARWETGTTCVVQFEADMMDSGA